MKKRYKSFFLLAALILTGCNNALSDELEIVIWEDVNNHELITELLDNYQAVYQENYPDGPKLKFTLYEEQESKAVSDLSLQAPSGEGPDIFAFVHDTLSSAVVNNLISEVMYKESVTANHALDAVNAFTLNDKLYGYPITAESQTLMYDKRKLTNEDVVSFEKLFASGEKVVLDVADNDSSGYYMFSFFTDALLFGESGTERSNFNLNTPETASNLKKIVNDYRGVVAKATPDNSLAIMQNNEAAAVISSPYLWPLFKNSVGESNAGIAVLPTIDGNTLRPFSGYKGYGVSRYAKNPHIAHDVARFLSSETAQRLRFARLGILPTYVSATLTSLVSSNAEANVFMEALTSSILMPNITEMGSFWAPANDAVTEIWNLGTTATVESISGILAATTTTIKNNF